MCISVTQMYISVTQMCISTTQMYISVTQMCIWITQILRGITANKQLTDFSVRKLSACFIQNAKLTSSPRTARDLAHSHDRADQMRSSLASSIAVC